MSTVNDMYVAKDSDPSSVIVNPLLPNDFISSFWNDCYISNYGVMDDRFLMKYKSFVFFLSYEDYEDGMNRNIPLAFYDWRVFRKLVKSHLIANEKKYSELYRIHCIDDDKYSIYDNYNTKEIMDRDITNDTGEQSSDGSNNIGARTDSNSHSVYPYDSDSAHPDSSNGMSYGAQHNTSENTVGARHDSGTEDYTLTKVGNIGIQTVTDMIKKHKDFWTKWEFIDYIFEQISKELLLVD